jgi:hypothetical protein
VNRSKKSTILVLLAISVFGCINLSGCSSSTSSSASATSGTVIDGYIENATVCADVNENSVCDAGEPSTKTDASGNYSLSNTSGAKFVIVETASDSKDADDGGLTLAQAGREPFTLSAPTTLADGQEKFVITPLTTMVVSAMQEDPTLTPTAAGAALVKQMGLADPSSVNMFEDYKAKGNTFVSQMAKGISDAMGESEKLAKTEAGSEFSGVKKDVLKDIKSRTWTAMVANISPDGKLIKPPSEFKEAVKAEVALVVETVVVAAKFSPDKTFMTNFKVEDALVVKAANGTPEAGKKRLYIGGCATRNNLSADLGLKSILAPLDANLQSVFCSDEQFATVSTVEIGDGSPWPVPQANALYGSSLSNSKWRAFPNRGGDDYYILTDEGLEKYDGDPSASPKPFRPRTANPSAPTITSKFDAQCLTVSASGYGEKYCFDPVKLEGKKVSELDPECKAGYGGDCRVSQANDKVFATGAMGFNVKMSYLYDTYQFFQEVSTGEGSSFSKISEGIAGAKSAGASVSVCENKVTGGFTYFFKFLDGNQIQLTGISGPVDMGCADANSDIPALEVTGEVSLCSKSGVLTTDSDLRIKNAFEKMCVTKGAFDGVKITAEKIGYSVVTPNTSEKAKSIEVFRTTMFGITKLIGQKIKEQVSEEPLDRLPPTGFAATVVGGKFMLGVYYAKDAPVWKLSFMDGSEKVFNDIAGKSIFEAFGAPKFEAANIEQVDYK